MDLPEKVCKLRVMHDHGCGLLVSSAILKPFLLFPLVQLLQPTQAMYFYTKVPPPQEERLHETACEAQCDWATMSPCATVRFVSAFGNHVAV